MEHGSVDVIETKAIRRIDKVISYIVSHAYVKTLVFVAAFLEGIISPLPPEVVVAAILSYRKDISWKRLSITSACGSAFGLSMLYFIGRYAYGTHHIFFDHLIQLTKVGTAAQTVVTGNPLAGAFFSTFTPLLDRVFTLSAGVFAVSYVAVLIGLFFGRLVRVGIVAYFSARFGPEARKYIVRHTKVAAALGILVVSYVALKALGIL